MLKVITGVIIGVVVTKIGWFIAMETLINLVHQVVTCYQNKF